MLVKQASLEGMELLDLAANVAHTRPKAFFTWLFQVLVLSTIIVIVNKHQF